MSADKLNTGCYHFKLIITTDIAKQRVHDCKILKIAQYAKSINGGFTNFALRVN